MRGPHNIWRLCALSHILPGAMVAALDALKPLRGYVLLREFWVRRFSPYLKGDAKMPPIPRALTALGPAYIKFGQYYRHVPDVVGDEIAQ